MEPNNLIDRNILSELFIRFPELKATQIARGVGINPSLMHHYLNGSKTPSPARIIEIEEFLHKLGEELIKLKYNTKINLGLSKQHIVRQPQIYIHTSI